MPKTWKERALLAVAASALGLALATSPAGAQDYNDEDNGSADEATYDQTGPDEEVEVTAPRERLQPGGHLGGPLQRVSLSSDVPYGDLNLRTRHGARELRARIHIMARDICNELDSTYPGPSGDSVSCYRNAVHGAMSQANDAIADARDYSYDE